MTDSNPDVSPGIQRQMEIYKRGLAGKTPGQPISAEELERKAKSKLKPETYDYLAGGAGSEETMRANREAFRRWRIVPRLLRNVDRRDLGADLLGRRLPAPLMLAPIGVQSIFHKGAELAVARAARALGIPFILSTVSSRTMEEVADEMGDIPRWFQLYWPRSDELAASFLRRAEQAGYGAIVVTLDTYLLSWRERDLQNAYLPFIFGEGLANYFSDPVFRDALGADPRKEPVRAIEYFAAIYSDPSRTWDDLAQLRQNTGLPILLKGILDPDDARRAVDHGMAGVIVSNHGGRQLDGAIAALDALPRVVDAVGDRTTVLFDSGIRRGADVIKAMALGARGVLLGRPYCFGLAVGGEQGVRDVVSNLLADIDLTLGLAGCASFAELGRTCLEGSLVAPPSAPS
ncbi:MAG TPA: lactate 2-monooxygenase [Isosphaeraceae bacterium]|nr:lactate 2-monooxygenase [Isosphaeraceae bacterium]